MANTFSLQGGALFKGNLKILKLCQSNVQCIDNSIDNLIFKKTE